MKRKFRFSLSTFLVLTSVLLINTYPIKSNSANTNPNLTKIEKVYSARTPVASLHNYRLENLSDTGFDIVLEVHSDEPIRNIHLPVWKSGAYDKHSYYTANNVSGTTNIFKARINFGEIGSGSEYINFGVHPVFESVGYSTFLTDAVLEIDTTNPNLSLKQNITEWTANDVTIYSTSSDDMNIVENIYFYDKSNNMRKIEKFSNPNILYLVKDMNDNARDSYKDYNINIVSMNDISSVTQLYGYDLVIMDFMYWGDVNNDGTPGFMSSIANQAFNNGIPLLTFGNNGFIGMDIVSKTTSTSLIGGSYNYIKKQNSRPEEFYNRGRANRFTYLIEGSSESDTGYASILPGDETFELAKMTYDNGLPESSSALMKTNRNHGDKWIHIQSSSAMHDKGMHKRILDELMHGFNRTKQSYSDVFTISENGTYKVEVADFSGNKTMQEITISNIDKTPPTLDVTFNKSLTNSGVLIEVSGLDTQSGVKRIKLPNGNYISSDRFEFTVNSNGTYTFECEDNVGNTQTKTITISNIDKTPPAINFNIKYSADKSSATLDVRATDNESGLKELVNWKNEIFTNGNYIGEIPVQGNYFFVATDLAGNKTVSNINIDQIISEYSSGIKEIQYRLLGDTAKDWSIYNNTFTLTNEGVTQIEAKAIDLAGNVSDIKTLSTQIDKTGPDYTYSVTYNDSKSLAFINVSVTDLLSGVKHIVDKDGNIVNSSNLSFTVDKNGQYLIFSSDNMNNIGIHSILVDGLSGGDASSGVKEIQYKLEGSTIQDWTTYNSPFKISNEGTTILITRAYDKAGNISNEKRVEIKIDKTKPASNQLSIKVL